MAEFLPQRPPTDHEQRLITSRQQQRAAARAPLDRLLAGRGSRAREHCFPRPATFLEATREWRRTMTIYGYHRVSDESQVRSGLSLAAADRRIRDEAKRIRGHKLARIVRDRAVSASRKPLLTRRGGAELDRLLQPGDHLIIVKLDRAFRDLRDFASTFRRWKERGVYLHLLDLGVDTRTPVGELVAGIMATVAQWESQRIGERTRETKAVLKARGLATNGRAQIGFRLRGKRLVPDPAQLRAMSTAFDLRRTKRLTFRQIAAELNRRKLPRCEGGRWDHKAAWRAWLRECERRNPRLVGGRTVLRRQRGSAA